MSKESRENSQQHTLTYNEICEEKLFYHTVKRINDYLTLRYLWMPTIAAALFLVVSYFGASTWIAYRVQDEISSTIEKKLDAGQKKIDSLVSETETKTTNHSEAITFYYEQMNVMLRSYELLLPYLATSTETMDTSGHIVNSFLDAYTASRFEKGSG